MRRRLTAALLAGLLPVTACALTGSSDATWHPAGELTLVFGGDAHFHAEVADLLVSPETVLAPVHPLLQGADLALINLETPLTTRGERQDKNYVFRADPVAATSLRAAGIDVVSLANNHTYDWGPDGLTDTIDAVSAQGVGTTGAGRNVEEAYTPWRVTVRGVRVAVFGFDQIDELHGRAAATTDRPGTAMATDVPRAVAAVSRARGDSDLVVVMPHWGVEGNPCPTPVQKDFAARMIEAGADVVVGAHAHVLQGAGRSDDAYVAYGLGNLLFYYHPLYQPFSSRSGLLRLTVHRRQVTNAEFLPLRITRTGQPEPVAGWQAGVAADNFHALRRCAGLG
ncbi:MULTISPECIES: CapA family protein [Catenuloplanes]|uniref:Poly-gamma-glutamate synthesis protein (Capsule biosynthesis protein) n=1 Tax=Catenuloplanes niger TaxID=587534 RepID=A0AAE3ZMN8_9ACTN|nr:CapA family protein [Catenuloplanes niger]MDR7320670.1 poly-gamma-glutamate synthesis protein (capsule biosynthesis protein) [Catenuloplanes niger]